MVLAGSFKRETIDKIRALPGVTSAYFLYGPYDLYVMIQADDREVIRQTVMKLREMDSIKSTLTCNILQQ
ncbi:Lrp/AsnC ligand binding domain-containing protein [Candidatus Bathyarchaeota archaeon]|nr:Lrp/AsnC ligand binding domain-containing protein [Candidatus Bathyarchaeota archaeon]